MSKVHGLREIAEDIQQLSNHEVLELRDWLNQFLRLSERETAHTSYQQEVQQAVANRSKVESDLAILDIEIAE